jgi:NAD(P)-dependent dehydrogenase (short-subunit alcohol dehydrogenase family)
MAQSVISIPNLAGKSAIVTGANSGIGYHTALELARAGAGVILACRNEAKADEAKRRILAEIPGSTVSVSLLDLADLKSIRKFAEDFLKSDNPLDLLINNAGVMAPPNRLETSDGFELQFGTNHLGHFALTGLLLPALLKCPTARVVNVSSNAHKLGTIDMNDLQSKKSYSPRGAYANSKFANILFTLELQRRLTAKGLTELSLAAHPGWSATSLQATTAAFEGATATARIIEWLTPRLAQADWRGALPTLYAAVMPDVEGGSYYGPDGLGEWYGNPIRVQPKASARSKELAAKLWQASETLTGVTYAALNAVTV